MDTSAAVQSTNDDASKCKRSAVELKYWNDRFLQYFAPHYDRKTPEINRGYFARTAGINNFVTTFLDSTGPNSQIINLGAGFDTLYWRLKDSSIEVKNFIDVDFPAVTSKKCMIINRNEALSSLLTNGGEFSMTSTEIHSGNYHIIGVDLKNTKDLEYRLHVCGVDYNLPTLFISECVLVYIEPSFCQRLLLWVASKFHDSLFVNYEQVNMCDRFGEVMADHFKERGYVMVGLEACKSPDSQKQRFLNTGWDGAKSWNMIEIYSMFPVQERNRVESIEFLDEKELLTQLWEHYGITIAWKGERFRNVEIR